jgi:uncharacterized protein
MSVFQRYAKLCMYFFMCLPCAITWAQLKVGTQASEAAQARLQSIAIPVTVSALAQYAAQGDMAVVDLLLMAGVSAKDPEPLRHVTALHNAAAQGHIKLVQRLIDYGADVNAQDTNGFTPLLNAVYAGHLDITKLLINSGADSNTVPNASPHALNLSVQRGDLPMFELLLKSVASVAQLDKFGHSPLVIAKKLNRSKMIAQLEAAQKQ